MLSRKILQIIGAEGWLSVHDHTVGDVEDVRTSPLVCWALVEDEAGTSVIGMDAEMVAGVQPSGRFLGYVRVGEPLTRVRQGR